MDVLNQTSPAALPVTPAPRPQNTSPDANTRAASAAQAGRIIDGQFGELAGISIEEAEKQLIRNTLKMLGGNREKAANILGIGERTLYRKIKEYGLKE